MKQTSYYQLFVVLTYMGIFIALFLGFLSSVIISNGTTTVVDVTSVSNNITLDKELDNDMWRNSHNWFTDGVQKYRIKSKSDDTGKVNL